MRRQDPRFEEKDSKILEFFRLMKRQFTTAEWNQICDENLKLSEQAENFFRFWTLKESFVKAIGHGLGFNLQRLSFFTHSPLQGRLKSVNEIYPKNRGRYFAKKAKKAQEGKNSAQAKFL